MSYLNSLKRNDVKTAAAWRLSEDASGGMVEGQGFTLLSDDAQKAAQINILQSIEYALLGVRVAQKERRDERLKKIAAIAKDERGDANTRAVAARRLFAQIPYWWACYSRLAGMYAGMLGMLSMHGMLGMHMHIIGLITQKGGTGKSTLASSLAVAAAEAGETVLAIDCDEQGTLTAWSQSRGRPPPMVASLPQYNLLPEMLDQEKVANTIPWSFSIRGVGTSFPI